MRFDLTAPCTNCPFRSDSTRITFAALERAEEIEENAYRRGFPCHVSAELVENPLTGDEGFVFGENSQHCAGYILMQLHEGSGTPWPGINNDEALLERLSEKMDWTAPVFHSSEEFFDANGEPHENTDARPDPERDPSQSIVLNRTGSPEAATLTAPPGPNQGCRSSTSSERKNPTPVNEPRVSPESADRQRPPARRSPGP